MSGIAWLGWSWENRACACRACVEAGRAPEFFEGSGFRVNLYEASAPNYSGQCGACGVTVTGEHCSMGEARKKKDMNNETADVPREAIQRASDATAQQAREVVARVLWTNPAAQERLQALPVSNDDQQQYAVNLLREIKAEWSVVDEERKKITKPLSDAKKATDALFKPVLTALEQAEATLKAKVAGYMNAKQAANVAALQAASVAATPFQAQQAMAFVAPVEAPQGVSVRLVWKFQVTEPDLVPRELCSPDPKKIGEACQYGPDGQPLPIPGVQWFQDSSVTVRK